MQGRRGAPLVVPDRVRHARRRSRLAAEGHGWLVGYDYAAGHSTPLPDALRERLLGEVATG